MNAYLKKMGRPTEAQLIDQRDELLAVLERYMAAHPAFRIKPEGAPGSPIRVEQERLMALEDAARAAIAKVTSTERSGAGA
jgi:hypothetical protein